MTQLKPKPWCQSRFSVRILGSQCLEVLVSVALRAHPRQPKAQVLVSVMRCRACFLDKAETHALVSVSPSLGVLPAFPGSPTSPRSCPGPGYSRSRLGQSRTAVCASSAQQRGTPWCQSHFSVRILSSHCLKSWCQSHTALCASLTQRRPTPWCPVALLCARPRQPLPQSWC